MFILYADCQAKIISFFRLALAAKQLADDAKDWEEDLLSRRITPVTIALLQAAEVKEIFLHPRNNLTAAHLIFASLVSQKSANNIIFLCNQARKAAKNCGFKPKAPLFTEILEPLEKAARRGLANYKRHRKELRLIEF